MASVANLQNAYSQIYPGAQVVPGEVYLSPGFEGGQNVFCAFDEAGKMAGYAPLYPVLMREECELPHTLWVEVRASPASEAVAEIKDQLFERILRRAREVTGPFPGHPVHLTFEYTSSETASIAYALSKGCQYTESVYTMRRNLLLDIPPLPAVEGVSIRPWRMESEAEQRAYVRARNICFPEAPVALSDWQYFMQSPLWSVGTTMAAFHDDELIGNVALFWDEAENQKTGTKVAYTEYIFVLPAWRGKRVARTLITNGLQYLKEHGLAEAELGVRAKNQNALSLYTQLRYEVIRESRFYVLAL
jgi:ribosomal protein S18 acetylase RimI-like enzyme